MWSVAVVSVWCDRTHYSNAAQICNLKKDWIKEKISDWVENLIWMPLQERIRISFDTHEKAASYVSNLSQNVDLEYYLYLSYWIFNSPSEPYSSCEYSESVIYWTQYVLDKYNWSFPYFFLIANSQHVVLWRSWEWETWA